MCIRDRLFHHGRERVERGLHRQPGLERLEHRAGHAGRIVADAHGAQTAHGSGYAIDERAFANLHPAGDLLRGLDGVTRIGEENRLAGEQEQGGVVTGEAGKIAHIGSGPDQQGTGFARGQSAGQPLAAGVELASWVGQALSPANRGAR